MGRLWRGRLQVVQFFIRRLLATFPEAVDFMAELLSALDLTADDDGFLRGEKAGLSAAFHRVGKAKVGAVPSLGIARAGASRLAAFDEALRGRNHGARGRDCPKRGGRSGWSRA